MPKPKPRPPKPHEPGRIGDPKIPGHYRRMTAG